MISAKKKSGNFFRLSTSLYSKKLFQTLLPIHCWRYGVIVYFPKFHWLRLATTSSNLFTFSENISCTRSSLASFERKMRVFFLWFITILMQLNRFHPILVPPGITTQGDYYRYLIASGKSTSKLSKRRAPIAHAQKKFTFAIAREIN